MFLSFVKLEISSHKVLETDVALWRIENSLAYLLNLTDLGVYVLRVKNCAKKMLMFKRGFGG